ncbi:MAG: hypothetical protein LBE35_07550 [Clostridiales bacterium]|jgi:hypothetical protein|nr:hypothetical protein [Clostridiales bacterium]
MKKFFIGSCDDCGGDDKVIVSAIGGWTDEGFEWADYHSWQSCFECHMREKKLAIQCEAGAA